MSIEPVLDGKGHPTGVYKYQGAVANRALELLGKELGMFVDRAEVRSTFDTQIANMTREERLALMHEMLEPMKKYLPAAEREGETIEGETTEIEEKTE